MIEFNGTKIILPFKFIRQIQRKRGQGGFSTFSKSVAQLSKENLKCFVILLKTAEDIKMIREVLFLLKDNSCGT
jgi:hypothetical protein